MSIAPKADGQRPKTVYMAKRRQQMGMTIDDAIKKYKNNAEYEHTHGNLQGCLEFQQLAGWLKDYKRLLEQEPTTKNDLGVDCISREQAQTEIEINASRYTIAKERGGTGQVEWSDQLIKVSDAVDIIRQLPSVTPKIEPRKGHWIDCDVSDDYSADGYDCSVCGVNSEYATSYCPNCGADMREVEG